MNLSSFAMLAGIAGLSLSIIMTLVWKVQEITRNTGWIDVFWTFGTGLVGVVVSLLPIASDPVSPLRRSLIAGLVVVWSLRLGSNILRRTLMAGDDPRYRRWIEGWGEHAKSRMFWHLQAQAAVAFILALAIIVAAHNTEALRAQDILGFVMLVGALIGEAVADYQLRGFKADKDNKRSAICDIGLWSWSRHPNYFFEWLGWLAYPIIAIDLSGQNVLGWLALLAPACMYYILVYVSGIPPLEEHMLRKNGDAFRAYQRRTSAFLPLPPLDR